MTVGDAVLDAPVPLTHTVVVSEIVATGGITTVVVDLTVTGLALLLPDELRDFALVVTAIHWSIRPLLSAVWLHSLLA